MSYTLRIVFDGMCLFVPKPAADGQPDRMHVLLPVHPAMMGMDDRHIPLLRFNSAHLTGDADFGIYTHVPMDGYELTLPDGTVDITMCPEIVNITTATTNKVKPTLLTNPGVRELTSRATLGTGEMTAVAPGACWEWTDGEPPRPLAHRVEWTADIPEADLVLTLGGLNGTSPKNLPPLKPIRGSRQIDLFFHHLPPGDLPPNPKPLVVPRRGEPAPHFETYFNLVVNPEIQLPYFWDKPGRCAARTPCPTLPPGRGGSPYTCMVAGGGL